MCKKYNVSATAYKVLALFKILCSGSFDIKNLVIELYKDANIDRYVSKEVIIKYIATLRSANIKIDRPAKINNYKYSIKKSPTLIDLNVDEIKILATLYFITPKLSQKRITENIETLLLKLKKFMSESHIQIFENHLNHLKESKYKNDILEKVIPEELIAKIEQFEKICFEDMRTSISYILPSSNKKIELIFEPKYIKFKKTTIYLAGYNFITGEKQLLDIKNICSINQLPVKSKYNNRVSPIIFKLKGKLANSYRPYESEKITDKNILTNEITVTSYVEDKDLLLTRVLKYGECCEIIYPEYVREEIKNIILKSLENYKNIL